MVDVLRQPVMIATALGLLIASVVGISPGSAIRTVKMLGDASVPLALFSLGVRMVDISFRDSRLGIIEACYVRRLGC